MPLQRTASMVFSASTREETTGRMRALIGWRDGSKKVKDIQFTFEAQLDTDIPYGVNISYSPLQQRTSSGSPPNDLVSPLWNLKSIAQKMRVSPNMFTATALLRKIDGDLFNKGKKSFPVAAYTQHCRTDLQSFRKQFIHSKTSGSPNFTHFLLTDPGSEKNQKESQSLTHS